MTLVWSYGGGVQTAGLPELPPPDGTWVVRRAANGYRLWRDDDEPGEGHQAPPLQLFGRLRRGEPDEANRLRSVREPRVRRVVRG